MGRASAQQQPEQQQQHDSQQAGAAPEDADKHTVDNWSEKDQRIIVGTPKDGYLFDLQLHAKVGHCSRSPPTPWPTPARCSYPPQCFNTWQ
jgi:hypothetical protein